MEEVEIDGDVEGQKSGYCGKGDDIDEEEVEIDDMLERRFFSGLCSYVKGMTKMKRKLR